VGANSEPDEKRACQVQLNFASRRKLPIRTSQRESYRAPFLFQPQTARGSDVCFHFLRIRAFGVPILQRSKAVAVQGGIGIDGVDVEALAKEQAGLAVRVRAFAFERNVRREGRVARHFLPHEMKRILRLPHVRPATGD
jgi:hypothetical protein